MKILFLIFLALFITNVALLANVVLAQSKYIPLENIPGLQSGESVELSTYLAAIYRAGLILASVLSVLMIVIGGIQYMTAGGNPGRLGDAKDRIWQAILGLLLVLGSYLILNTINPDLVKMELSSMKTLTTETAESLEYIAPPGAIPAQPPPGGCPPGLTWNPGYGCL